MKRKQAIAAIMAATIIGTTAFSGTVMAQTYTVQKGDTLSKIAKNNGTTVAKLVADNGIKDANKIKVGQVLDLGGAQKTENTNVSATKTSANNYKGILSTFFNATYYAAQNPDVVAVYGTKSENLFSHFLTYGIYEGRQPNPDFNVYAYMSSYKDLENKYGNDAVMYYVHYFTFIVKGNETRNLTTVKAAMSAGVKVHNFDGVTLATDANGKLVSGKAAEALYPTKAVAGNSTTSNNSSNGSSENKSNASAGSSAPSTPSTPATPSTPTTPTTPSTPDRETYTAAYEAWAGREPQKEDYLAETSYYEEYEAWTASEPKEEDYAYCEYESEQAATAAYYSDMATWTGEEPDFSDDAYKFNTFESQEAATAAYDAATEEYKQAVLDQTEYADDYAAWEGAEPANEEDEESGKYLYNGEQYESYELAVAAWEADEPVADEYITTFVEDSENADWVAENPEPAAEDFPYDENWFESEEAATAQFEEDHAAWVEAEPNSEDYVYFENEYESQEAATQAFNQAYGEWEGAEPNEDTFLDETEYQNDHDAWEAEEPSVDDYVAEYQAAHDAWEAEEPDAEEYLAQTSFAEDYAAWEDAEPKQEDYVVYDYANEAEAMAAYAEALAQWQAAEPNKSTYLAETSYDSDLSAWEAEEPNEEDYLFNTYESEEAAQAAYESVYTPWEAQALVFTNYAVDFQTWEDGKSAITGNDDDGYSYGSVENGTYEEALAAYTEANPEPVKATYIEDLLQSEETGVQNWLNSNPKPDESEYVYNEAWYVDEDSAQAAFDEDKNAWTSIMPDEDTYLVETEFADDYAAWEEEKPVREHYEENENWYESDEAATEAFNEAHAAWVNAEPQAEDYLTQTDYEQDMMAWVAAEPFESEFTGITE
ncbi:MAG: LysM peptidoglycan-binding domain-containing protein [Agathobacter sp.]